MSSHFGIRSINPTRCDCNHFVGNLFISNRFSMRFLWYFSVSRSVLCRYTDSMKSIHAWKINLQRFRLERNKKNVGDLVISFLENGIDDKLSLKISNTHHRNHSREFLAQTDINRLTNWDDKTRWQCHYNRIWFSSPSFALFKCHSIITKHCIFVCQCHDLSIPKLFVSSACNSLYYLYFSLYRSTSCRFSALGKKFLLCQLFQ